MSDFDGKWFFYEYEWKVIGSFLLVYLFVVMWEFLRFKLKKKVWVDCVWFKGFVLKLVFNMWIVNVDRLFIRVRLVLWGF